MITTVQSPVCWSCCNARFAVTPPRTVERRLTMCASTSHPARKGSDKEKKARKCQGAVRKGLIDAAVEVEGVTYAPGAFRTAEPAGGLAACADWMTTSQTFHFHCFAAYRLHGVCNISRYQHISIPVIFFFRTSCSRAWTSTLLPVLVHCPSNSCKQSLNSAVRMHILKENRLAWSPLQL